MNPNKRIKAKNQQHFQLNYRIKSCTHTRGLYRPEAHRRSSPRDGRGQQMRDDFFAVPGQQVRDDSFNGLGRAGLHVWCMHACMEVFKC